MNRVTMTFLVLAAMGGCMAVDRDVDDYGYPTQRRPTSQSWAPATSPNWRGADGRMVQAPTGSNGWGGQGYGSGSSYGNGSNSVDRWMTSPSTTTSTNKYVASTKTSSSTTASRKSTRPTQRDDKVVQTSHTESTTGTDSETGLPTATAGPKSLAKPATTEAKAPPINLGVLRLLNSKRITFHYEVKDPNSSGVSGLELWGTTDTRSWKKYDIVTRTASSLVVDVKEEGLYGFSMIARGKSELTRNQPPQPGEAPQVWVAVDLTKPTVQMLGAELNIMSTTPSLVVRWSAKDQHFGPRPITLSYAERLEGPWTPIAANLDNTGRYDWNMPACTPARVMVRVQAMDLMGNTSMAQSATLHIPGRVASSPVRGEPTAAEPPHLSAALPPPPPYEANLRPIAATVPNPAVSILSVDTGE